MQEPIIDTIGVLYEYQKKICAKRKMLRHFPRKCGPYFPENRSVENTFCVFTLRRRWSRRSGAAVLPRNHPKTKDSGAKTPRLHQKCRNPVRRFRGAVNFFPKENLMAGFLCSVKKPRRLRTLAANAGRLCRNRIPPWTV